MNEDQIKTASAWWLFVCLCVAVLAMGIRGTWINPSLFQAGLFLLACFWAGWMIYRPYPLRGSFVLVPLGAAAIWPLVQLATNQTVSRWETWNAVLLWSGNFSATFLSIQIFSSTTGKESRRRRRHFLQAIQIFAFGIVLLALLDHLSTPRHIFWFDDRGLGAALGPFLKRNRLAAFGELVLPLFLAEALDRTAAKNTFKRGILAMVMGATVFAAIVAAASRAGAAIMTAEVLVIVVAARQKREVQSPRFWQAVGAFAAIIVTFTALVGAGTLAERFNEVDPYASRLKMLESSVQMIKARPVFGFGMGNFENSYPGYAQFDSDKIVNHAHNDWAEWSTDGGIPFLILLAVVGLLTVPIASRSIWGLGTLGVFTYGFTDFPLQNPTISVWLFTIVGVLATRD